MINLRHKIDAHCTINNQDVGNYAHTLIGNDTDFYHPMNVQNAVMNVTTSRSAAPLAEQTEQLEVNETEQESSRNKKKMSICTNWINFPQMSPTDTSNSSRYQVNLHFPIYKHNATEVIDVPAEPESPDVSVMTLFNLQQPQSPSRHSLTLNTNDDIVKDLSSTNVEPISIASSSPPVQHDSHYNNIGAMIICSEHVWMEHIVPSGMVVSILQ